MILKRIISVVAVLLSASAIILTPASADDDKVERVDFTANEDMLTTDSSAPTISFDTSEWEKYVHLTSDAELLNLKMKQDTSTFYQGASLKISSNSEGVLDQFYTYSDSVRNSEGNLAFFGSDAEDAEYITPGIELRAEDFGLSCFDGCLVSFTYRMGVNTENTLMENSVYAFATDNTYDNTLRNAVKLTYDVAMNDNVTQYRTLMVTVAENEKISSAKKIVFEIPMLGAIESDILYLDNIQISTPLEKDGNTLYVKNIDSYNANAKPQEIIDEVKISEKGNTLSNPDASSDIKKEEGLGTLEIALIIGGIAVLVGGGIFIFIKHKTKFY